MSICMNGSQSAAGNSLNMLAFRYNFVCILIFLLISSTFHKLYNNIKSVYVTNEQDSITAGNIIDLLYIRDHCSMSKLNRMYMAQLKGSYIHINLLYIFLFIICMMITRL